MKAASADLIDLLANANAFVMWEVYTITLVDGSVLIWTNGDVAGSAGNSTVAAETTANLVS